MGKGEREGERNCFQDKKITKKIFMLVNGEVLTALGGPAPLTGPRAPQVLDPAQPVNIYPPLFHFPTKATRYGTIEW